MNRLWVLFLIVAINIWIGVCEEEENDDEEDMTEIPFDDVKAVVLETPTSQGRIGINHQKVSEFFKAIGKALERTGLERLERMSEAAEQLRQIVKNTTERWTGVNNRSSIMEDLRQRTAEMITNLGERLKETRDTFFG